MRVPHGIRLSRRPAYWLWQAALLGSVGLLLTLPGCFTNKRNESERLYLRHCSSCHGEQGEGIGQLVPPLAASDYLAQHPQQLPCIIRHGLRGNIVVNGVHYNVQMLGVEDTTSHQRLSPAKITNLLNYIEGRWGNHPPAGGPRTFADTEAQLRACDDIH